MDCIAIQSLGHDTALGARGAQVGARARSGRAAGRARRAAGRARRAGDTARAGVRQERHWSVGRTTGGACSRRGAAAQGALRHGEGARQRYGQAAHDTTTRARPVRAGWASWASFGARAPGSVFRLGFLLGDVFESLFEPGS